eukprot:TRINITY_DN2198_c5_g2_i1.p1 TRINITY_DN2198_c5_g2~~TRINITY_DN2198_c5_g2_i1.p1  ORF type:complete len:753 (+),score=246.17 TRINITY_DN2198_c5_g2_i1:49-2307(+)
MDNNNNNNNNPNNFSGLVKDVMSELVSTNDPLDTGSFNPTNYINKLFPTEESLEKIDEAVGKLKIKVQKCNEDILGQVRDQSITGFKAKKDLEMANRSIQDLFNKIYDIKNKAEKSEEIVTEISRDIKSLDYAKKNLTDTIRTLQRLQMYVTCVDQLKVMMQKKQYKEIGIRLEAVNTLSNDIYDDFKSIAKIEDTSKELANLKKEIVKQIHSEFDQLDNLQVLPPYYSDLCYVIDALGDNAKREFMRWFVMDRLQDYKETFRQGDSLSRLENIKVRFQWLMRELDIYDQRFNQIFPAIWRMPQYIFEEFAVLTRDNIITILEGSINEIGVKVLMEAMKATIRFEIELCNKFANSNVKIDNSEETTESDTIIDHDPYSPQSIKNKWKLQMQEKQEKGGMQIEEESEELQRFRGIISKGFEPYLEHYLKYEDGELNQTFLELSSDNSLDERNKILSSSEVMFERFKSSMNTCTSLTVDKPFFDLFKLLKKYINQYTEILMSRYPQEGKQLTASQEKIICFTINTADYCSGTIEKLEGFIKKKIIENRKESVEFLKELEAYNGVVAKGVNCLVKALEAKLEPALVTLSKTQWDKVQGVGDQSVYVDFVGKAIKESVPNYHACLSSNKFKFFCDSFINSFVPKLSNTIFSCNKMSAVGAEQLLLDTTAIKDILLELPKQGLDRVASRYNKFVKNEIDKIEKTLKVIMVPVETIVDTYIHLVPKGNSTTLQKILDLKSIKKGEQAGLLEDFQKKKK